MPIPTNFRAASEAAEACLTSFANARYYLTCENQLEAAWGLLWHGWSLLEQHGYATVLEAADLNLAAVSDGVIRYHVLGSVRCLTSAHAALLDISDRLYLLVLAPLERAKRDELKAEARRIFVGREELLVTIPVEELQARIRRERAKLLVLSNNKVKRTGRPRKGESDKQRLVIGALVEHHRYQSGGIVQKYAPAKTKTLAELASGKQVKVSAATVSRFFKIKFPDYDRGYDGYVAACNRDARVNIGMRLAEWQGEVSKRLASLLSEESGREGDD